MDYHIEFLLKILVCFLLSACIGVERQFRAVGCRAEVAHGADRLPVYRLHRPDCRGLHHPVAELFHAPLCARLRPGPDHDCRAQPGFMHQAQGGFNQPVDGIPGDRRSRFLCSEGRRRGFVFHLRVYA